MSQLTRLTVLVAALAIQLLAVPGVLAQGPPSCSASTLRKIAFGVGTSAPQVEGGAALGGRSPSIWDTFAKIPGKIQDGSTPAVATDFYHKYKEDIALLKEMGVKNFRMSLSWSRLVPQGKRGSPVNPEGVAFYNAVFDELIKAGISPVVTLFHWDLPQVLQDDYEGFVSPKIIDDFVYYADVCFKAFGDKVKKWSTFNEPHTTCNMQYGEGTFAPGVRYNEKGRWPCGHYLLLAHARAVKLYRDQYKPKQGGKIGMVIWAEWAEPYSNSAEDRRAAQNKMDIDFGWFADAIHFGDYPPLVKAGKWAWALPSFTAEEKALLKGSYDYMGATLYTGKYARSNGGTTGWNTLTVGADGKPIGTQAESYWLYDVPWALGKFLDYVDARYGSPEIWLLESGFSQKGESKLTGAAALRDTGRIQYYSGYMSEACRAVDRGVKFTHYITWSFTDNWEWREGFVTKYGLVSIDFSSSTLTRRKKDSANWLAKNVFSVSGKS